MRHVATIALAIALGLVGLAQVRAQEQDPSKPRFYVEQVSAFNKTYHAVMLDYWGESRGIVEVLAKAGSLPTQRRAEIVAERMAKLQQTVPGWSKLLKAEKFGRDYVVVVPNGGQKLQVVTADVNSMREAGESSTKALAKLLIAGIDRALKVQTAMRGGARVVVRRAPPTALQLKIAGDRALKEADYSRALELYQAAVKANPKYAEAYLRIAATNSEYLGEKPKALDALRSARRLNLSPAQRRAADTLEPRIRANP